MPTETFTKKQFEDALPVHKTTRNPVWEMVGFDKGEYVYSIKVSPAASILVRSSVGANGFAAATGEDSIRLWLVDPVSLNPVSSKLSTYITRVPGWQTRLVAQLRTLFQLGLLVHACPCGNGIVKILKVKKEGPNKGKLFTSCSDFTCKVSPFTWLPDEFQAKKFQAKK